MSNKYNRHFYWSVTLWHDSCPGKKTKTHCVNPYGVIPTSISTSFNVVVVSWLLICCSFISWELTCQIDVSLKQVLVRDTWGITLLTLDCLCCFASGDFVFGLMGSINLDSVLTISVLTTKSYTCLVSCVTLNLFGLFYAN